MKKNLMTLAAVLLAAMITTTVFTACGSDDDDDTQYLVSYTADGNLTSSSTSLDMDALLIIPGFNSAISSALGGSTYVTSSNTTEKDAAVKRACDAYYSTAKASYNATGQVTITKTILKTGDSSYNQTSTLATYTFE